jgi:dipeptidase
MQRVPDDHITVIANQFIIRELDDGDSNNYMSSSNVREVAERNGFWSASSGKPFDFS